MYIGFHITNQGIFVSDGTIIKELPFLGFLLDSYQNYRKVFYDLDSSVASLCHLLELDNEELTKLHEKRKLNLGNGYKLTYFPESFFSIDYGAGLNNPSVSFSNMSQDGYSEPTYQEHETDESSLSKAKQALLTANEIGQAFKSLGLDDNITSPVKAFLRKYTKLNFPTASDCPDEINELAWKVWETKTGQWFECYKMGHFPQAYDIDANGSFAFEMSLLPDLRKGHWVESPTMPDNASLGYAEGLLSTQSPFHPFQVKLGTGNYTLTGKYPDILLASQIRLLNKWKLGEFKIDNGHWFISEGKSPYFGVMNWLYNKKRNSTGKVRTIITRIYSALWGLQSTVYGEELGDMFCPVIATTTQINSQLRVADACLSNNIIPLMVMADGFITDKQTNLPISDKLGEWKISAQGKCLILGTTQVAFENNKLSEFNQNLALNYRDMVEAFKDNPELTEYKQHKFAPVTLAQSLKSGHLGEIREVTRTTKIGQEDKRFYLDRPKCAKDLLENTYDSSPLDYKFVTSLHNTN